MWLWLVLIDTFFDLSSEHLAIWVWRLKGFLFSSNRRSPRISRPQRLLSNINLNTNIFTIQLRQPTVQASFRFDIGCKLSSGLAQCEPQVLPQSENDTCLKKDLPRFCCLHCSSVFLDQSILKCWDYIYTVLLYVIMYDVTHPSIKFRCSFQRDPWGHHWLANFNHARFWQVQETATGMTIYFRELAMFFLSGSSFGFGKAHVSIHLHFSDLSKSKFDYGSCWL